MTSSIDTAPKPRRLNSFCALSRIFSRTFSRCSRGYGTGVFLLESVAHRTQRKICSRTYLRMFLNIFFPPRILPTPLRAIKQRSRELNDKKSETAVGGRANRTARYREL